MGNCLIAVQHIKQQEKTETSLPTKPSRSLKQQWTLLLITPEFSRTPSLFSRVNTHSHPTFAQINKDIDRTYPFQPYFNLHQNKKEFKQLLQMIALYYPRLGYVQGMNFIAGYLVLVGMNKNEAFNVFKSILFHPKLMFIGIYEDNFPLVRLNCRIFWSIFEEESVEFALKVKELNLPDQLWIFQWCVCLFIYSFPRSYISNILSFIWKEKQFACIRLALALIKLLQRTIKGKRSFQDEFIESIQMIKDQDNAKKNVPIENLIREAQKISEEKIKQHLSKLSANDIFSRYFTASPNQKTRLYTLIVEEKERDRKQYYNLISKGEPAQCITNSSVTIIDEIEQKRAERYYGRIHNSLSLKVVNKSFIRFQKRYSFDEQLQNNAILTESLYKK